MEIKEPQICFVSDGFMKCNWKWLKGKPTYTKSGKWWTWPARYQRKQKEADPEKK